MNKISSNENKELLWNLLYNNDFFKDIPNEKIDEVESIFEKCISNIESNIINDNYNLIEVNKLILKDIISKIKLLKKKKTLTDYELLQEDFNKYNNLKTPDAIDFSDKIENTDVSNIQDINLLLENLQSTRDNDIKLNFSNNNIIDLNNMDSSENNIDISDNNILFKNNITTNFLKKDNIINQEYKYEKIINLSIKLDYIIKKLEELDNNQKNIFNLLNKKD